MVSFVDLAQRPPAPGELRRFIDRFGPETLFDTDSRAYRDGGLAYLRMDRQEMTDRLLAAPGLLKLPLVRSGNQLAVGRNEDAWKRIASAENATG